MNIFKAMETLLKDRRVFHSEADFQFSLGWELKMLNNDLKIIMERPFQFNNKLDDDTKTKTKIELDLLIKNGSKKYGIELKYVTKELVVKVNDELFDLKNHMATNLRRYDFYKDISRLESLKINKEIDKGYVIFLTNVPSYQKSTNGMAEKFNFADGCKISQGKYDWSGKRPTEKSHRKEEIEIKQQYYCRWNEYSTIDNHVFKYILLEI